MLGGFVTGWLSLETKTSCLDFWPVRSSGGVGARAEITPILYFPGQRCPRVRGFGRSSGGG